MQFINFLMLFGLAAIAIPIIIQLLTRKNTQRVPWGAWLFLKKTMEKRKRKMLLEDILLLACRCLALGLLALGFARPFVRPDSPVPWAVTLPLLLVAITAIGVSFALWRHPKQRRLLQIGGGVLLALALGTILFERYLNLKRFGLGATKDVVLLIDGSASMSIAHDGKSNFERALEETKKYVDLAPRNTSFAVILGGPVPQVLNPVPIADRRIVHNTLDRLHPVNGTMRIGANLTAAAVTLAAGHNAVKQIVIVGDGQTVGWQLDDPARWEGISKAFAALKTRPIISWRTLPLPTSIRNLAIESVRPSRSVVGTDRPVSFAVTLVNAGTEAVTPKGLSLTVEGKEMHARSVGQLEVGESRVFTFTHRFTTPGGVVVTAKVEAHDDLPADDTYSFALPVQKQLKTLIVTGEAGGRRARAATYLAAALRDTTVEDAVTAGARESFVGYSVVVLAGVRRLSDRTREALLQFVRAGGGLLVLPQAGTVAADYNEWKAGEQTFLPASLGTWRENKAALEPESFAEQLKLLRTGSDLAGVTPERILGFGDAWTPNASCLARLADGTPLLLQHTVGRGTVMASAVNFDPASGLVLKRGFLPFVQELVMALAQPSSVNLDVHPAEALTLLVASGTLGGVATSGPGLIGYYYPQPDLKGKPVVRVDRNVDFNWGTGAPIKDADFPVDYFSVRWRGALIPPAAGKYKLWWDVDDRLKVRIGGREINAWSDVRLEAKPYAFECVYAEDWGEAKVKLRWQRDGGEKRTVPPQCFVTFADGVEGPSEIVAVKDPHGEVFYAEIFSGDTGLFLRVTRPIVPGVYEVSDLTESTREALAGAVGTDGKLRFTVSSGVEESTMTAVTQSDLSKLADYVQISQAIKDEDVIKSIGGESFGKEVWRILAILAFLFLVAEPLIARWVAINRRTGDLIDTEGSWIRT